MQSKWQEERLAKAHELIWALLGATPELQASYEPMGVLQSMLQKVRDNRLWKHGI